MAKSKVTCENCGFEEELTSKELKARNGDDGLKCAACGEQLALTDAAPKTKKSKQSKAEKAAKYSMDAKTGLDDVLENQPGDQPEGAVLAEAEADNQPGGPESSKVGPDTDGTPENGVPVEELVSPASLAEAERAEEAYTGPDEALKNEDALHKTGGTHNEPPKVDIFGDKKANGQKPGKVFSDASATDDAKRTYGDSASASESSRPSGAKEKLREAVKQGREDPIFVAGKINSWFRSVAGAADNSFDSRAKSSIKLGQATLLITAVFVFIAGVLISLRSLSFWPFLLGVLLSASLFFAQYLALKGFELLDGYIEKSHSRLPGKALAEVLSAFSVLLALLALAGGLILTIGYLSPVWLGYAVLGFVIWYYASAAFLECYKRLNVSFNETLPVSEIIVELVGTKLKALVAVLPFIFGIGSAALAFCMFWPMLSMLLFGVNLINRESFEFQRAGLLFCAFSPIIVYFYVILWEFLLQVARGLLGIGKNC